MKLTIDRTAAFKAMQIVAGAIASRSTIPILSHVLLRDIDGALSIAATDLDIFATVTAVARIEESGSVTIEGGRFLDLLRNVPEGAEIGMQTTPTRMAIVAGRSKFQFPILAASDFPTMKSDHGGVDVSLKAGELARLIDRSAWCANNEETRFYLNGAHICCPNGHLRLVATNGHVLGRMDSDVAMTAFEGVTLPNRLLALLAKTLAGLEPDDPVDMRLMPQQAAFSAGNISILAKVLDGQYPDYERVIPNGSPPPMSVDASLFAAGIKRAIVASDNYRGVTLSIERGRMTIKARGEMFAEGEDEIEIDYDGEPFETKFQADYLLNMLAKIGAETIVMKLAKPLDPAVFAATGETKELFVIMPQRA